MSKIKILVIPPDTHGVGKYRMLDPYTYIQEHYPDDFHVDIKLSVENNDDEFKDYDIIIIHSFVHNKLTPDKNLERIEWLKKSGKIVIVDFDDYWEIDMRHPLHFQAKKENLTKTKLNLMKSADYITVTTPIYKETLKKKFGYKNVYVFSNAINENEEQFKPKPLPTDKIRFGYLGGSSHLYDIQLIENGIKSLYNTHKDKIQFVLCGYDLRGTFTEINRTTGESNVRPIRPEETVWFKYEKIFTNDYKELDKNYENYLKMFKDLPYDDLKTPYVRRWTLDIKKYATNYNYFDVSLAPLVPSVFNSHKSQLKAIESGFHKKAIIASETEPYTLDLISAIDRGGTINPKGNSLLVSPSKDHKQWYQHMKRLIENPNMIEDLGNKLYETVKDKYSLKTVCKDRVDFLKLIINKK